MSHLNAIYVFHVGELHWRNAFAATAAAAAENFWQLAILMWKIELRENTLLDSRANCVPRPQNNPQLDIVGSRW